MFTVKIKRKSGLALLMLLIFAILSSGCSNTGSASGSKTQTYKAGSYTASKDGKNGSVTIKTTFSDTAITAIDIVQSDETEGLGDEALSNLSKTIIQKQTLAVDTTAGAIVSSKALLDAVEDCVKQAGGNIDALKAPAEGDPK